LDDAPDVSRQTINAIETGKFDPSLPIAFGPLGSSLCASKRFFHDEDRCSLATRL
jgi:hypothetical protein